VKTETDSASAPYIEVRSGVIVAAGKGGKLTLDHMHRRHDREISRCKKATMSPCLCSQPRPPLSSGKQTESRPRRTNAVEAHTAMEIKFSSLCVDEVESWHNSRERASYSLPRTTSQGYFSSLQHLVELEMIRRQRLGQP